MINKIHYQYGQEELVRSLQGEMTTFFFEGHRKSAASDVFTREKIAQFSPPKGKFGIHCVIVGAQEFYGPNRNGDGFPSAALIKYSSTFVTHGHMFREHRNRDPKLAIGEIKAAAYHPKLHRTELILWGDCEKAAAEYEDAKAGKHRSYSMSCRVPADYCSCCHNKAASTRLYCDHLKYHMLQFLPEFNKYAFAENRDPLFFDASDVGRPADRIAHALEYILDSDMAKAASDSGRVITGAELAEMSGVTLPTNEALSLPQIEMLNKLAAAERHYKFAKTNTEGKDFLTKFAREVAPFAYSSDSSISQTELDKLAQLQPCTMFYELAKRASLLPFDVFVDYINGCKRGSEPEELMKYAATLLPDTFAISSEIAKEGSNTLPGATMFEAGSAFMADVDPGNNDDVQQVMDRIEDEVGSDPSTLKYRASKNVLGNEADYHNASEMEVSDVAEDIQKRARTLVGLYGAYKIASILDIAKQRPELDMDCLTVLAVAQNK